MYYLVGLGNPGEEYESTRHNVGFLALDFLIKNLGLPQAVQSAKYSGLFINTNIQSQEVSILYPNTYMNNSGAAVKKLVPKKEVSNLVAIYDDIALPFGEVKISFGRGDGGHNGIKSIISELGTKDFVRIRIGVSPTSFWTGKTKPLPGEKMSKFVLSNFTKREFVTLEEEVLKKVEKIIVEIVESGHVKAMNVFNQ